MTSSQVVTVLLIIFITAGSMFFIGRDNGRQIQAEQYADAVSEIVDILIRGTTDEE